jgi:hypothetical protein
MVTEVYDAMLAANVPEDKARKVAEVMAGHTDRTSALAADVALLKWMIGVNIALTLIVLGKLIVFA